MSDISLRKLPPYNLEAEQYVLGACIKSGEALAKALEILDVDDFYKTAHKKIFHAMLDLFGDSEVIDLLTLTEKLRQKKELDATGGMDYLDTIEELVPTSEAITHHAKILRNRRILRDIINKSTSFINRCYEGLEESDKVLDWVQQEIFSLSIMKKTRKFSPMKKVMDDQFHHIEISMKTPGAKSGLETGFVDLDRMTAGLQPSDLIIVAGRPSMGKTSFALDIACYVAIHKQTPVAIFSLEMSVSQLGNRMLCAQARVNSEHVRSGFIKSEEWKDLTNAGMTLAEAPIFIDDSASLSILELRASARQLLAEHPVGLIIIDYLQLMHSLAGRENRQLEISEISRGLKALAKELNIPIIALSQLSRALEIRKDKRPILSDLRESGSIEQDADVVICIYRDEVYNKESEDQGLAEILIRKQRNGPIGDFELVFLNEYTKFVNIAKNKFEENEMQPWNSPS